MFGGKTYDAELDGERLEDQLSRVKAFLFAAQGSWVTLQSMPTWPGEGLAALTARARDLRKQKFGGFNVECRRRPGKPALYEYRILTSEADRTPPRRVKVSRSTLRAFLEVLSKHEACLTPEERRVCEPVVDELIARAF